jgi:PTH1 family peptidyl-tRNA hydrolase
MKYLIVGLGNIGADYHKTRHNIGFDVLDALAAQLGGTWKNERYAAVAEVKSKGRIYVLAKPSTYMNLSGQAVRYWLEKEKIPREQLIVILDDLNLPLGKLRIRQKGSAGGHNGLKNIEELLNTGDYPRLRIGIGDDFKSGQQVDFVLGHWTTAEQPLVDLVIEHSTKAILSFGFIGLERTMNTYNALQISLPKPPPPPPPTEEEKTDV